MTLQCFCFKASKTLSGIETSHTMPFSLATDCFKASKTLSGIETAWIVAMVPPKAGFKASKTLSGIETPENKTLWNTAIAELLQSL